MPWSKKVANYPLSTAQLHTKLGVQYQCPGTSSYIISQLWLSGPPPCPGLYSLPPPSSVTILTADTPTSSQHTMLSQSTTIHTLFILGKQPIIGKTLCQCRQTNIFHKSVESHYFDGGICFFVFLVFSNEIDIRAV